MAETEKKSKKIVFYIVVFIISFMAGGGGVLYYKIKNGESPAFLENFKIGIVQQYRVMKNRFFTPDKKKKTTEAIPLDGEKYVPYSDRDYTEMYKYRDEKGVLHFTDKKPAGIRYETIYMPANKKGKGFFGLFGTDEKKNTPQKTTR